MLKGPAARLVIGLVLGGIFVPPKTLAANCLTHLQGRQSQSQLQLLTTEAGRLFRRIKKNHDASLSRGDQRDDVSHHYHEPLTNSPDRRLNRILTRLRETKENGELAVQYAWKGRPFFYGRLYEGREEIRAGLDQIQRKPAGFITGFLTQLVSDPKAVLGYRRLNRLFSDLRSDFNVCQLKDRPIKPTEFSFYSVALPDNKYVTAALFLNTQTDLLTLIVYHYRDNARLVPVRAKVK